MKALKKSIDSSVVTTITWVLMIVVVSSCKNELSPSAYVSWVRNSANGLKVERKIDPYTIAVQYKPQDYMALQEIRGTGMTAVEYDTIEKSYEGAEYYDLGISVTGSNKDFMMYNIKSPNEYFTKEQYMTFQLQKHLTLVAGRDTLPCKIFHFERNYNSSPTSHFSIGFDEPKEKDANRLIIYDDEILGLNQVILEIQGKNIAKVPRLKYSQNWVLEETA